MLHSIILCEQIFARDCNNSGETEEVNTFFGNAIWEELATDLLMHAGYMQGQKVTFSISFVELETKSFSFSSSFAIASR